MFRVYPLGVTKNTRMGNAGSHREVIPKGEAPILGTLAANVNVISFQGFRSTMEDAYCVIDRPTVKLYAVFDGHCGDGAVDFTSRHLLFELASAEDDKSIEQAFVDTEARFKASRYSPPSSEHNPIEGAPPPLKLTSDVSGTCATVAIRVRDELIIANVGDCTAMLISHDGSYTILSKAHRLEGEVRAEEEARIVAAGSYVEDKRVKGELAVSRAIGDFQYKGNQLEPHLQAVTCIPSISRHQILSSHKFLLLFSDGVGDGMSNDEIRDVFMAEPDHTSAMFATVLTSHEVSRDNTVLMCIVLS